MFANIQNCSAFRSTDAIRIQMFTCGKELIGVKRPWKMHQEILRRHVSEALCANFGREQRVDLVLSCTDAWCNDPGYAKHLCGHWGEHPGIMRDQLASRSFVDNLSLIKQLDLDTVSDDNTFYIALVCNKGRHRSVAQAKMLSYVLKAENFCVEETEHLQRQISWDSLCTTCNACGPRAALGRSHVRQAVLDIWAAL